VAAQLAGDEGRTSHPLHTDVTFAAASPFSERIAHGMLVLAVGGALAFRLGPHLYLPRSFVAFYGMERVRFIRPVKIGDTLLRLRREAAVRPRTRRGSRALTALRSNRDVRGETYQANRPIRARAPELPAHDPTAGVQRKISPCSGSARAAAGGSGRRAAVCRAASESAALGFAGQPLQSHSAQVSIAIGPKRVAPSSR
jgi:acyl dehydratase